MTYYTYTMLSIVSVPIGNLKDITLRALEVLRECDAIVCEDTRVTGQLLKLLELPKKELISFHGYSDQKKLNGILRRLEAGEHLALVSDAGTPCISDPGFHLVKAAHEFIILNSQFSISIVPGPSAFLAALSASGLPINRFTYLGFPPMKKGRQTWFEDLADYEHTIVFYESVHRIEKTLLSLSEVLEPDRVVVIVRELTKMHEEVLRTSASDISTLLEGLKKKGEFVLLIGPSISPHPNRNS